MRAIVSTAGHDWQGTLALQEPMQIPLHVSRKFSVPAKRSQLPCAFVDASCARFGNLRGCVSLHVNRADRLDRALCMPCTYKVAT